MRGEGKRGRGEGNYRRKKGRVGERGKEGGKEGGKEKREWGDGREGREET